MLATCIWQTKFAQGVDNQLLNVMNVSRGVCWATFSMFCQQVQQRIPDQLSWSVIRDVSAAMNGNKVCPNFIWIAFQILFKVRLLTIGKHVLMLYEQQMLIYAGDLCVAGCAV